MSKANFTADSESARAWVPAIEVDRCGVFLGLVVSLEVYNLQLSLIVTSINIKTNDSG